MPDNQLTADLVLGNSIYAKGNVTAYRLPPNKIYKKYTNGQYIGDVYSWVNFDDGLYWMFMDAFDNAYYVLHKASSISLPALPDIKAKEKAAQDAIDKATKGDLQYYIEKYAPYIVGAVVVSVALPSVTGSLSRKKVSGMKNNTLLIIGAAALAFYIYSKKKKTKAGAPIIENIPVDDPFGNKLPNDTQFENYAVNNSGMAPALSMATNNNGGYNAGSSSQRITSVGIFPVTYGNALAGKKGDLGSIKMH